MPALPSDSDFNDLNRKQSEFRAATAQALSYLRGLLGADGLSSTARQFLGISTATTLYASRGAWASATSYFVNDYVTFNSALYVAVNAVGPSASNPTVDTVNWQPFQSVTVANFAATAINLGLVDEYSTLLAGAVGDGVADDTIKIQNAAGQNMSVLIVGTPKITGSITFNQPVRFAQGAKLIYSGSGITVTFNSDITGPDGQQLWVPSNATATALATTVFGTVSITKANPKPEWWGDVQGAVRAAIESLPAAGGIVELDNRRYRPNGFAYGFGGAGVFIGKDGVTLRGSKMPQVASDCRSLINGTIIEDMVLGYANNLVFEDLGIDSGETVIDTYFASTVTSGKNEGLLLSYPSDAVKNASTLKRGVRMHNVVALVRNPTDPTHSIIAGEGYDDVVLSGSIVAIYGLHGVVFKCSNVRCESLESFMQSGEGCIIKTDVQSSAIATAIQIGKMALYNNGPAGTTPYVAATGTYGLLFNPAGGNIDGVQIGEIYEQGHAEGVRAGVGSNTMSRIQIGSIRTDGNSIYGTRLVGVLNQCSIESITGSNSQSAFSDESTGGSVVTVGTISGVNNSLAHVNFETGATSTIELIKGISNPLMRMVGNARPLIDKLLPLNGATFFTSASGGLVPSLSNDWINFGGANSVFGVRHSGHGIWLQGLIKSGTSNTIATLPFFARPALTKRLLASGFNGSVKVAVDIVVDTSGIITINEVAGGTANVSSYLSLDPVFFSLLD